MKFVGSTIIYSYLQAVGVIYSHDKDCFLYKEENRELYVPSKIKAMIAGLKALVSAIAAGGWVAVVVILIICLVGLLCKILQRWRSK